MIQLEDTLAQVRKEYEMLRIEFEQTLAANEQAGTIILALSCSLLQAPSFRNNVVPWVCWYEVELRCPKEPSIKSLEFILAHSLGVCFSRLASFAFFF